MFIAKFIEIERREKDVVIYAVDFNSIVSVSYSVLDILNKLKIKYGNNQVKDTDPLYRNLCMKNGVEKLYRYNFITNNTRNMETKYKNFTPTLKTVYLHVTQECNFHCTYCYAQHNLGKGMMMRYDRAKKYINKLYAEGIRQFILTGGEPLLNPDIDKIINYIRNKKDVYIELLSNGSLINYHILSLKYVDNIIISLDIKGSNNRKGISQEKILKNICGISKDLKDKISIRSVISKGEEKQVFYMKEEMNKLGFNYIYIPRLPNNTDDLKRFPNVYQIGDEGEWSKTMKVFRCGAGMSEIAVDWNGDIYPCQNLMRKNHLLSSLNNEKWNIEILNAKLTQTLKKANILEINKCKNCNMKYLCGGGCRALSYNVYGSYDHCLDFYCDYFYSMANEKLKRIAYNINNGGKYDI